MPKIAVFGDSFVDFYWEGSSTRISPEAPIPVVNITNRFSLPGGAANVIANLEALGATVNNCTSDGPIKNRLMVGNTQLARWDVHDFCQPYEGAMPEADAYIISDYAKGGLPLNVQWPRPLFIDTKRSPSIFPEHAILFPNEAEYAQHFDAYRKWPIVILKRGAKGAQLIEHGVTSASFKSAARHVVSVNGAGDTVLAAFVVSYLKSARLVEALEYSLMAAALAVEQPWTSTVTEKQIAERFLKNENTTCHVSSAELAARIDPNYFSSPFVPNAPSVPAN